MKTRLTIVLITAALLFSSCGSMNNTQKGAGIGAGGGAALGALVGQIIGHNSKSTAIGAAIGAAVGTGAGAIIGKKMDRTAEEAARIEGAQVEQIEDNNGLQAVKVTFDSGILFDFNKSVLSSGAKQSLTKFARLLNQNPTLDIAIYGHTDKVGSIQANEKVSMRRARAVEDFLRSRGVSASQFKEVVGKGYSEYNESLSAAQNRRVEVYMYASEQMIREAEAQSQQNR